MLTMLDEDRRQLTAGLLRVLKAAERLANVCLSTETFSPSSWAARMAADELNMEPIWDSNRPFTSVRSSLLTGTQAALQHGLALFELTRSSRALAVPLATVTRGAVESFGRVYWLLHASTPSELINRRASLEYSDMRYPEKHGLLLRRLPIETVPSTPVDGFRQRILDWLATHDLQLVPCGTTHLAIAVLGAKYANPHIVYSGLSATAHGLGWATANFYSFEASALQRDDKMLIEYCMYVIETTRTVVGRLSECFVPRADEIDRWTQTCAQLDQMLAVFVTPTAAARRTHPGLVARAQ